MNRQTGRMKKEGRKEGRKGRKEKEREEGRKEDGGWMDEDRKRQNEALDSSDSDDSLEWGNRAIIV